MLGIVLAGGQSQRFGQDKARYQLRIITTLHSKSSTTAKVFQFLRNPDLTGTHWDY